MSTRSTIARIAVAAAATGVMVLALVGTGASQADSGPAYHRPASSAVTEQAEAHEHDHGPLDPSVQVAADESDGAQGLRVAGTSRPNFHLPFACKTTWRMGTYSGHANYGAVDLNWTGGEDAGKPVLASAAGTVTVSRNMGNRSYGNWIEIRHANGWKTRYAHLSQRRVAVGASVKAGQLIGNVGNTGNSYGAHLHYEQHSPAGSTKIAFEGRMISYSGTLTSRNCGGSNPGTNPPNANPYTVAKICGSSYRVIDRHQLDGAVVYLAWSNTYGKNCVTTIKTKNIGTKTKLTAALYVQGKTGKNEGGSFRYYAGPVKLAASRTCVKYGGSSGDSTWASSWGHCG